MKHKTWIYKGVWQDDFLYMIVELGNGKNVSFFVDGFIQEFNGKTHLERIPGSWELVE